MLIGKGGWEAPICTSFGSSKSSLFGSLTLKCISILILLFLLAWLATALCSEVAASWLQEELWHWTPATDIMIGKQHLVYQFFIPCVPPSSNEMLWQSRIKKEESKFERVGRRRGCRFQSSTSRSLASSTMSVITISLYNHLISGKT